MTFFDQLLVSIQSAANFNHDDVVAPVAILWPDEKREWERLVSRLRMALPHFFVFGPYDPTNRSGPAIWLRCVLAGKVAPVTGHSGSPDCVPIIYLPGVSRATLRATDECPGELKPLAELQYRGVFWSQQNTKDWTVTAFLQTNHGGLQLKIAKDQTTVASIRRTIERLVDVPIAELQAKSNAGELNAAYFDSLISDDPVDDLLTWLSDPNGAKGRWDADRWEALCRRCVAEYGFDPIRDGELVAAEMLGIQKKAAWKTAWKRFVNAPLRYAGLAELLRKAKPKPKSGSFAIAEEQWPQDNETKEAELRQALLDTVSLSIAQARESLLELDDAHRHRRDWVWAKMNRSPLAAAMKHLAVLAQMTQTPLTGATTTDMVNAYTGGGWQADAAVLDALVCVTHPPDREAVCSAIAQVYGPWLRDAAEEFQIRVKKEPLPGQNVPRLGDVTTGTCVFFVDGLRYDVGQKLKTAIEAKLGKIQIGHHFSALPSVTPTAKPAVSPAANRISGSTGESFLPCVAADAKDLTIDRFRKLLDEEGFQVLGGNETGDPTGRAWTEFGNLDSTGHKEGIGLASRIPELIAHVVYRIETLLAAGWREIRIVTDHGWLLLPKNLPKSELHKYLTATRWGRCAVVKPSAMVKLPMFSWFWSESVTVACPEGISSFFAGQEYNHGGLSLQECVVPQFTIQAGKQIEDLAKIETVKWAGLRCRVKVGGQFDGCKVDLRDKAADVSTSLTGAKPIAKDGAVSLVVTDDSREGSASTLILLDMAGNVIEKMLVTVGG
jgi:hypothetical protein